MREQKAEYVITYQGRPVAFLSPVDEEAVETAMVRAGRESAGDGWEAYLRLIDEIRSNPLRQHPTQDLMDETRR